MDEEIKEGFLCPICLKDLKSPTNLSNHFEEFHADDKAILHQLRSIFGKAKNKLIKSEDVSIEASDSHEAVLSHGTPGTGGIDVAMWPPQVLGCTRSHMVYFRDQRKSIIDRWAIETNKLIIRLEKLINSGINASDSSLPGVSKVKKDMEKSIVPWQNDKDVKFCSNCGKKFTMTFRKHHCRLCGKIVCELCLGNLSSNLASTLLNADISSKIHQSSNSDSSGENGLKLCDPCQISLLRQSQLIESKNAHGYMVQLYEKMQQCMQQADLMQPTFLKMANSLNLGETDYGIDSTVETRSKLLKAYESVEALSKKIQLLGVEREKQPHPNVVMLQRYIRAYASNYLAENMFSLPSLPTKEQYQALQKKREVEREKVKQDRLERISSMKSSSPNISTNRKRDTLSKTYQSSNNSNDPKQFIGSNGIAKSFFRKHDSPQPVFQAVSISKAEQSSWSPQQTVTEHTDDPILQQINNLKSYIEQARAAHKYDELQMFEQNLKELQSIYQSGSH